MIKKLESEAFIAEEGKLHLIIQNWEWQDQRNENCRFLNCLIRGERLSQKVGSDGRYIQLALENDTCYIETSKNDLQLFLLCEEKKMGSISPPRENTGLLQHLVKKITENKYCLIYLQKKRMGDSGSFLGL